MKPYSVRLAALLAGCWLATAPSSFAESIPPAKDEGFEVLARGPMHEAFAQPSTTKPEGSPIVPKQPPKPIDEEPPAQKPEGANVQWLGGYWSWDDDMKDFIWVSGFWRDVPPGRQWVPGYWTRLADGWQRVSGFWAETGQSEFQFAPEPPDTLENGPSFAAPGDDYFYAPGSWVWRSRYVWRPGHWLGYRPGWVWVPPYYAWTPSGCVYVSGYWDYPLESRGLLFAPVYFRRPLWDLLAGWCWRPSYCVYGPGLFSSLFIRPGCGYYYGDYFGPRYAGLGFTPWINFRIGRSGYDPLFNYYRWQNRRDRNWEPGLASLYADRHAGRAALPPRTLSQQTQLAQNTTINTTNRNNLTLLAPLSQATQTGVKLQNVTANQLHEHRDGERHLRTFSQQRQQIESQIAGGTANSASATPRVAKFDVPKLPVTTRETKSFAPPDGHGKTVTGPIHSGLPNVSTPPAIKAADTTPRSITLPSNTPSGPTGAVIQRSIHPPADKPHAATGKSVDMTPRSITLPNNTPAGPTGNVIQRSINPPADKPHGPTGKALDTPPRSITPPNNTPPVIQRSITPPNNTPPVQRSIAPSPPVIQRSFTPPAPVIKSSPAPASRPTPPAPPPSGGNSKNSGGGKNKSKGK